MDSIIAIAFLWGAFSAVSLPLGAILGLAWKPNQKINSAFMAFGAGALLFALTIELFGHVPHHADKHGIWILFVVVIGALLGGGLFDLLNNILNNQGAYLRKLSSAKRYIARIKLHRTKRLIEGLGQISALRRLSPEKIGRLIKSIDETSQSAGKPVFKQGDEAAYMFFIISGEIEIIIHEANGLDKKVAVLKQGDTFGEMGVLMGVPRTADAVALTDTRLYRIGKNEFDKICRDMPELKDELQSLAKRRLSELSVKTEDESDEEWKKKTLAYLNQNYEAISMGELKTEGKHHDTDSASLAIWLGILIDGIPESFIIGILALNPNGMSLAFIAGVFLANLPEAMSSAVNMQNYGMSYRKILMMWGSLCLMTGIGAAIGAGFFPAEPTGDFHILLIGIESLAAGAMLTMIAETMLPEAYEHGGSIVGVSTLLGFLTALLVKVLG